MQQVLTFAQGDAIVLNFSDLGRLLLIAGGVIVLLGLALIVVGRIPFLGRLPGDVNYRNGNFSVFIPVVSCLLLSILLTVIVNVVLWLTRR